MYKTFQFQVDIDLDDYARNYGSSDRQEAVEHAQATANEAIKEAFERTGGWASILGDGVEPR